MIPDLSSGGSGNVTRYESLVIAEESIKLAQYTQITVTKHQFDYRSSDAVGMNISIIDPSFSEKVDGGNLIEGSIVGFYGAPFDANMIGMIQVMGANFGLEGDGSLRLRASGPSTIGGFSGAGGCNVGGLMVGITEATYNMSSTDFSLMPFPDDVAALLRQFSEDDLNILSGGE